VIGGEDRIPYLYLMDRPKVMKIADDTTLLRKTVASGRSHRRAGMVFGREDCGWRHGTEGEHLRR